MPSTQREKDSLGGPLREAAGHFVDGEGSVLPVTMGQVKPKTSGGRE